MYEHEIMDDNYCSDCESEYHRLIEKLVTDIQHLETKAIYLRYLLSRYLPKHKGEMLRCDIFHDLYGSNFDQPAYQRHVKRWCNGRDPLDNQYRSRYLHRIARGEKSVGL